jgi:hypothetical protein
MLHLWPSKAGEYIELDTPDVIQPKFHCFRIHEPDGRSLDLPVTNNCNERPPKTRIHQFCLQVYICEYHPSIYSIIKFQREVDISLLDSVSN